MPVNTILGLFAKSPLKPLQEHASSVHQCCSLLVPFFQATAQQQWENAQHLREQISMLEKQADALKREIRLKLPRGLFLPVDRTDMLDLVTQQYIWLIALNILLAESSAATSWYRNRCKPTSWFICNAA